MRIWTRRSYTGRRATTVQSYGTGQYYGRQRLMPREVAIRRRVARWNAQKRQQRLLNTLYAQQSLDILHKICPYNRYPLTTDECFG